MAFRSVKSNIEIGSGVPASTDPTSRLYLDIDTGIFYARAEGGTWAPVDGSIDGLTASASELNVVDGLTGSVLQVAELTFTETTGAGTYTGSVALPAGATVHDIIVNGVALWNTATSATLIVGDVADPDGFYTGVDLKATDLLAGESLSFSLAGGKAGAYIANSQVSPRYSASARTISAVVTAVGASGSAGRTRVSVVWSAPQSTYITAATKA